MLLTRFKTNAVFLISTYKLNKNILNYVVNGKLRIILGGDFNVTLDSDLDCSGGRPFRKDSVKHIQDLWLKFDLVDIWRIRNSDSKRFTWRQRNPFIQRRLDYWLISDVCIFLHFNSIDKPKQGPSFWKFNVSLVNDDDFVTLINENVPLLLEEFKDVRDKRLLWDLIKYRIRQSTIKYSKEKARERRRKIPDIEVSLKISEERCSSSPAPERKSLNCYLKNGIRFYLSTNSKRCYNPIESLLV